MNNTIFFHFEVQKPVPQIQKVQKQALGKRRFIGFQNWYFLCFYLILRQMSESGSSFISATHLTLMMSHSAIATVLSIKGEGYSFFALFYFCGLWLLAPSACSLWLLASGCIFVCFFVFFSNFSVWGSFPCYLLHFKPQYLICELTSPICMRTWLLAFGFWLWLHLDLALGFGFCWLFGFGFTWLLAFGRTSVECMCSIVVCI